MGEVWYYKGVHKVKILTESEGYWIVEALEEFEDDVDGEKVTVKVGEQRIVPSESVHERKFLAPPVKEHSYELKMEKKLKRLVAEEEKKDEKK
jgi:predicted ATP-grasp superfamily ATP-dependent carboligase